MFVVSFVVRFLAAITAFAIGVPEVEVIVPETIVPDTCASHRAMTIRDNRKIVRFPAQT